MLATVTVVEAETMWRIAYQNRRFRWERLRRIALEMAALFLTAATASAVSSERPLEVIRAWPGDFFTVRTIGLFVLTVAVWASITAALDDLARLGELSESMESEYLPLPRLRWRWLAWFVVLVSAGSVGLTGWGALVELSRPMAAGLVWPALVYLPVGIVALGRVAQHDAHHRWRASHVRLEHLRGAGLVTLIAMAAVAAILTVPTADSAPALRMVGAAVRQVGRVGQWIVEWIAARGVGRSDDRSTDLTLVANTDPSIEIPDPDLSLIEPGDPIFDESVVELIGDVVFWGLVAVVMGATVWVVARLRRDLADARSSRPSRERRGMGARIRGLLTAVSEALRALMRGLRRTPTPTGPSATDANAAPWSETSRDTPTSAIRRIVAAYAGLVDELRVWVAPRGRSETVSEYQARATRSVPDVATETVDLSRVVERARYSDEVIGDLEAERAEKLIETARAKLHTHRSGLGG